MLDPYIFAHAWNNDNLRKISGMAIRHCIELGYHRSAERYRRHVDPLTKEMSKRCFWVAYDIDRVAAFILGRPVGVPDELIDAEVRFVYTYTPILSTLILCRANIQGIASFGY
jgi:hypothetical protein